MRTINLSINIETISDDERPTIRRATHRASTKIDGVIQTAIGYSEKDVLYRLASHCLWFKYERDN